MIATSKAEIAKIAFTGIDEFTSVYIAPAQRPTCC